jgi:hypothetical protein
MKEKNEEFKEMTMLMKFEIEKLKELRKTT